MQNVLPLSQLAQIDILNVSLLNELYQMPYNLARGGEIDRYTVELHTTAINSGAENVEDDVETRQLKQSESEIVVLPI